MSNTFVRFAGAGIDRRFVAQPALGETLFKIVTVKDEVIVGLNDAELGGDAGGIAKAIASKVFGLAIRSEARGRRRARDAPVAKIGMLANNSLRVEPFKQPFKVLPHE